MLEGLPYKFIVILIAITAFQFKNLSIFNSS